jgi:hypothetical protein
MSFTLRPTVCNRCSASPSRASGGTDWLSARSMSSRSGAVYCMPVRPVRSSVVSAAVNPHRRLITAAIPVLMFSSMVPRGLPRESGGGGATGAGGTALLSAITVVSGRGVASPAWIVVATVVRMACASSASSDHTSGGIRIWVRGSSAGVSPRHSNAPSASWRRAVCESWRTGISSEGSR